MIILWYEEKKKLETFHILIHHTQYTQSFNPFVPLKKKKKKKNKKRNIDIKISILHIHTHTIGKLSR